MIDYLSEIKPLEDQGISFENIAVHLNSKTLYSMQAEECRYILQDNASVLLDPVKVNQRSGSLIDYYQSLEPSDEKDLIAFFLGRIYGNDPVSTDQYPRSIQFASVESSLPNNLQFVAQKLVESAGGGRPHSGITEQDVIDCKAAYEQAEADRIEEEKEQQAQAEAERQIDEQLQANDEQFWSLFNQHLAPLKDAREVDGWQAAIQAMADGWVE